MKKTLIIFFSLLSLSSAYSQWTTRQLPTPRTRMAGVYADGKAIFAGGLSQLSPQYTASAVVDIYDLATANWTSAALSIPRFGVSAVVSGDKILFAGGITLTSSGNSVNSDVVDIYDIPTASWSQTTLPVSASDLSAAAIGDKVYFAKGSSFGYDDIWIYEVPTGLWSILEIPGGHRQRMSVAAIGSKILFAGGLNDNNQSSDILNIYDTETNTWSVKTLSEPRSGIAAVTLGTSCYFTGGLYGTYTSDNMDIYDDATGEISSKTMPVPRFNHAAGTHNGEIMIGSQGELSSSGGSVDIYYPQSDTWSPSFTYFFPDFTKHAEQTAVSTPAGVFFAGGISGQSGTLENDVFILSNTVATKAPATQTLQISPTIADNMVHISLPDNISGQLDVKTISVIDFSGRTIPVTSNMVSPNSWEVQLPAIPSGNYILRMSCKDHTLTGRFIKQ